MTAKRSNKDAMMQRLEELAMLSHGKGGMLVWKVFLVSSHFPGAWRGGESSFGFDLHSYKEMCLLLRRQDYFSRDPSPLTKTTERSKLLQWLDENTLILRREVANSFELLSLENWKHSNCIWVEREQCWVKGVTPHGPSITSSSLWISLKNSETRLYAENSKDQISMSKYKTRVWQYAQDKTLWPSTTSIKNTH